MVRHLHALAHGGVLGRTGAGVFALQADQEASEQSGAEAWEEVHLAHSVFPPRSRIQYIMAHLF